MKRKGFTLIELIVVVVVMGVVVGIAIPSFRAMNERRGLSRGKGMVFNAVLGAKARAASDTVGWELLFDGTNATAHTISWSQVGVALASKVDTLPRRCFYAQPLTLTFVFNRDGSAQSPSGVDTFSLTNNRNEQIHFTLIPQIGEVRAHAR